jgi:molybdopterin-binding protein
MFVEFALRNPVVSALRLDGLNFARVNPSLESGIADPKHFCSVTRPHQLGVVAQALVPPSASLLRRIYNRRMTLSARNKLRGQIEEILLGDVMAHVVVRVGDNIIESVITRRSADELKLKKGDTVSAVVKATEVMIQKD